MPVHFWFFRVWVVYTFSLPVSLPVVLYFLHHVCLIQVTIALRFHLFPFRTEKLSSVTPMVLRNSGRVGSRRFFRERSPCIGRCRGFLVLGLSFRTEKLSSFVCLALPCFACFSFLFFSLFCLFSWGQQIFSADYSYTCEVFFLSLLLGYYIVSYPYHIIYLASISSYAFLFLCLKECYASVYLPLSSVYFPVLLFISFFLVILLLSLRNKTGEKRYFL